MADSAPIEPTMKYWKTLLPVSPVLERYFFQAAVGMLVVLWAEPPLKGLSKEAWGVADDEEGRICTAVAAARTAGNCERMAFRASELADLVSAGMVVERRGGGVGWIRAVMKMAGNATLEVEVQCHREKSLATLRRAICRSAPMANRS